MADFDMNSCLYLQIDDAKSYQMFYVASDYGYMILCSAALDCPCQVPFQWTAAVQFCTMLLSTRPGGHAAAVCGPARVQYSTVLQGAWPVD